MNRVSVGIALVAAVAATGAALFLLWRSSVAPEGAQPRGPSMDDALVAALEPKVAGWVEEYRTSIPTFSLKAFWKVRDEPLTPQNFVPVQHYDWSPTRRQERGLLYEFSPDGAKFVDAYVGTQLIPSDGGGLDFERDVDIAVVLVDMRARTATQVLFCGPSSCDFHGAAWLSGEVFAVYGWDEDFSKECASAPCASVPALRLYDLRHMRVTTYHGPAHSGEPPTDLIRRMLKRRVPDLR